MMAPRLSVDALVKHYRTKGGAVRAVDGVSFECATGETLALVGESGCGKSTIAKALLGLVERDAGTVMLDGKTGGSAGWPGRIGIVFQNPYSSLNPRMRVHGILAEGLRQRGVSRRREIEREVGRHLAEVGLGPEHARRFPHEFSGGQRQRIAIARALALRPDLLVLDEPTAALDVSVQAQILNLLRELQDRHGLSYLLISHNLASVESIAHRVMVMYFGRIVEAGPVQQVFRSPAHPYTRALLAAVPSLDPSRRGALTPLEGVVPSFLAPPPGCAFAPRCPRAADECGQSAPALDLVEPEHRAACFFPLAGSSP